MISTKEVKCKCCQKNIDPEQSIWNEKGKYYLCLKCDRKIKDRQNEQVNSLGATSLKIDREELIFLRGNKVLSLQGYIFLALRMDFSQETTASIDIKSFCDRWCISQYDLIQVLSRLGKKGFIYLRGGRLELQVLDKRQILNGLEAASNPRLT